MARANEMMSFKVHDGEVQRFREIALALSIKYQRRVTYGDIIHMALSALQKDMGARKDFEEARGVIVPPDDEDILGVGHRPAAQAPAADA